jgi:hypothetical protein
MFYDPDFITRLANNEPLIRFEDTVFNAKNNLNIRRGRSLFQSTQTNAQKKLVNNRS